MKKTIALALVAASFAAFPVTTPAFAVDTDISPLCGPDAPEAYKRPGGYCEQIGSNNSLFTPQDDCEYMLLNIAMKSDDAILQVADYCYYGVPSLSAAT